MPSIRITRDQVRPALQRLRKAVGERGVNETLGQALTERIQDHFLGRAGVPNALGGRTTRFWERAATGTRYEADTTGATIFMQIPDYRGNGNPIAQRLFGGTITARPGHALAIPATAEMHGRTAREERRKGNTKLVSFGKGPDRKGAIVRTRDGKSTGEILFWLCRSVHQAPDPTVLPSVDDLRDAAYTAVADAAEGLFEGALKP